MNVRSKLLFQLNELNVIDVHDIPFSDITDDNINRRASANVKLLLKSFLLQVISYERVPPMKYRRYRSRYRRLSTTYYF